MRNIFFRRQGQIAPFMIAIMVVLIMALMVTVNIGKIGLTKTHTANAADAGALAGASIMANGLNAIGDMSEAMLADYLATAAILATCWLHCITAWIAYFVHLASQITLFALAWSNGRKTCLAAKTAAKQFAFINAGIDEAKERLSGESYEAYLQRESRFGQWMKDKGYESGQYSWTDKNRKENSVKVEVDAPAYFILVPMSGVIFLRGQTYIDGSWTCKGCTARLPTIAAIATAINAEKPLSVKVTRVEPQADLGIWNMKYAKQGERGITSYSKAKAYGGMVIPFVADYDSKIVWTN
jgi:hypothetical protein